MSEKILQAIGALLATPFVPLIGAFLGGVGGWVAGLFFTETVLGVFDQLGIHHVTMWQLGVALGFLSGFVRGR